MASAWRNDKTWMAAGFAAVVCACLPLFDLRSVFAIDWANGMWMANYFGAYLRAHWELPCVLNTFQLSGMAYPAFYGYLFFPLIGALGTVFDANLVLRVAAFALLAAQFCAIFKAIERFTINPMFACLVGTLVTWAIYPLTNIYNRGALPEFFAVGLLTCAIALWMLALRSGNTVQLRRLLNLCILSLTLSAGTHPITALYGLCFFALLVPLSLALRPNFTVRQIALAMIVPACLGVICLAPWVVNTCKYKQQIAVSQSFQRVGYFARSLDSPFARLTPFPIPWRSFRNHSRDDHVGTRYLDTQINVPLAIVFFATGVGLIRRRLMDKRLAACTGAIAVLFFWLTWISLAPGAIDRLGETARSIQFAYRTITYINMSALAGVLLLVFNRNGGSAVSSSGSAEPGFGTLPLPGARVSCALACIAAVGLSIKLYHAQRIVKIVAPIALATQRTDFELLTLPETFYGHQAYATPGLVPGRLIDDYEHAHRLHLTPETGKHFGELAPTVIPEPLPGWTLTNVQVAPWNRILIDQRDETSHALSGDNIYMFLDLHPGVLSYSYAPDQLWLTLHRISFPLLSLWILVTAVGATHGVALPFLRRDGRSSPAVGRGDAPEGGCPSCVALPSLRRGYLPQ